MLDSLTEKRTRTRGPGLLIRMLGTLSMAFTVSACGGGNGSSWYNPVDWFGSDEEESVSDDRDVAGGTAEDGLTGGEDTRRLADLIVAVSLEPTTSGAILLVNAKSGIPGFHSVRLHRVDGARGQDGNLDTLVYEVHGLTPPTDAQTSQLPGNAPIDLSIGTFIPTSTLNRSGRIRVIGKQNAIELTI